MPDDPLQSLAAYTQFITHLIDRPDVVHSTLIVWSTSPYTGVAEGEILFTKDIRLRIREEIDFDAKLITAYGYEVYQGTERLYWYDDFPHPNDSQLTPTLPHHKHVQPDTKHNRIPAPEMSFIRPNLPELIREIENL